MTTRPRTRSKGSGTLFKRRGRGPWIASWYDHDGRRRERSTRTTDRAAAERILAKKVADTALRRDGVVDPREEAIALQRRRPLADHLDAWRDSLRAKGTGPKRLTMVFGRASRLADGCGFQTLADVEPGRVRDFVRRLQDDGAADRTINGYLQAFKQFIRWAVGDGRLAIDPLAGLGMVRVVGQRRTRRPMAPEELWRVIDAAETGPAYRRTSGPDRAMLYRLAAGTGLRAAELRSLTPASFDLASDPPVVRLRAAYSKRRRDDVQPIRPDLADLLRAWLSNRPRTAPVFTLPDKLPPMLRADLRRARARWIREAPDSLERRARRQSEFLCDRDSEGRVVDFHALRATFITMLVKSGASVKEAQELARHSDPKLTMNVYTSLGVHDAARALDRMPSPAAPDRERNALRATGTEHLRAEDPQRYSQQLMRRTPLSPATPCDEIDRAREEDDAPNLRLDAALRDSPRPPTTPRPKATSGTRTPDLSFTKAPLYQLS